ncbi:uncharacterized protein BKCO1_1800016 [Diplodia corticola]|uniref:Uncharacterized protein n=1 Tax=Diplodia corticola TaxID=236234 RepID=A0A1J9R4V8_9PEZI|nr:uncharacterized protein BKCO1_1800016 [Diplodia corticola]OJD35266.1 hypothetical protein BKCO1_1800016 [Diplodia corticola]
MSSFLQRRHSTTSNAQQSFSSAAETLMSHENIHPFDGLIIQALPADWGLNFVRQLWAPYTNSPGATGTEKAPVTTRKHSILSLGGSAKSEDERIARERFFEYYLDQCEYSLRDGGKYVSVRTHRDILELASLIKDPRNTRKDVARKLRSPFDDDDISETSSCIAPDMPVPTKEQYNPPSVTEESIQGSIDLVARLLTMINFGKRDVGLGPRGRLMWMHGSLSFSCKQYFDKKPTLSMKAVQLEKVFNARNLQRFTGMEIEWTDNLADHLRMCEFDKKIRIFHHVTFLENHKCGMLPPELINETLKTIDLLFPSSDPKVRLWYEKHRREHGLDPSAAKHGSLRAEDRIIDNFYYWKDRICILKQEFDEGTPKTFRQWWCDRRSGPQWYTFWIAIVVLVLTVFFGLIQSLEGAMQVYKAFQPDDS